VSLAILLLAAAALATPPDPASAPSVIPTTPSTSTAPGPGDTDVAPALPSDALLPPVGAPSQSDCWTEPLKLRLGDFANMGVINDAVGKHHCLRRMDPRLRPFNRGIYTVGKTRFGHFTLFGEEVGYGLNLVVAPGLNGAPDFMYTAPALDLPPAWQQVIDTATYPVLVIGGAAIFTSVIIGLIR